MIVDHLKDAYAPLLKAAIEAKAAYLVYKGKVEALEKEWSQKRFKGVVAFRQAVHVSPAHYFGSTEQPELKPNSFATVSSAKKMIVGILEVIDTYLYLAGRYREALKAATALLPKKS